ncbi:basic salivary proline-rich protein 1-like [Schistocerca piceifrons]|uniref:basic salivary proline-rich protein 1-like n=1 Tax=Schistocerca piceifrons TaxID=274613 RepID=UPI001F5F9A8B|nr:basic salivary proline-rich protein 1-like [Schistocerca piceifrons]
MGWRRSAGNDQRRAARRRTRQLGCPLGLTRPPPGKWIFAEEPVGAACGRALLRCGRPLSPRPNKHVARDQPRAIYTRQGEAGRRYGRGAAGRRITEPGRCTVLGPGTSAAGLDGGAPLGPDTTGRPRGLRAATRRDAPRRDAKSLSADINFLRASATKINGPAAGRVCWPPPQAPPPPPPPPPGRGAGKTRPGRPPPAAPLGRPGGGGAASTGSALVVSRSRVHCMAVPSSEALVRGTGEETASRRRAATYDRCVVQGGTPSAVFSRAYCVAPRTDADADAGISKISSASGKGVAVRRVG